MCRDNAGMSDPRGELGLWSSLRRMPNAWRANCGDSGRDAASRAVLCTLWEGESG